MVKVIRRGAYYMEGRIVKEAQAFMTSDKKAVALKNRMSVSVAGTSAVTVPEGAGTARQYLSECVAEGGKAIPCGGLGALGALSAVKEYRGAPVVALYLRGKLRKGVGPVDVALSVLKAHKGFLADKLIEVIGGGSLSQEERNDVDALLPLTGCAATVWQTDARTEEYYKVHGRSAFRLVAPKEPAYYDGAVCVDLARVEPMIAYSASNVMTVEEAKAEEGGLTVFSSAEVADVGAAYEGLAALSGLLKEHPVRGFSLSVVPSSLAAFSALGESGYLTALAEGGATLYPTEKEGASLRSDRFTDGALADPRTIAMTAANGGVLTSALGCEMGKRYKKYRFDGEVYRGRKAED